MELVSLIKRYPNVYHMADAGTWETIREHGLLSTSAALDRCAYSGAARANLEENHRPLRVTIQGPDGFAVTLRDQAPMAPDRLVKALQGSVAPGEWYRLLNGKVFFWAERHRLERLLRAYDENEHDVLTIETASLLGSYAESSWVCHMNSGNTFPIPHYRTPAIFQRIANYPTRKNGAPIKEVVELLIDYHVPDIMDHVVSVVRMKGAKKIQVLHNA